MYQYLKSFPQKDRYTLGQKIENLALSAIETTFKAGISQKQDKLPFIEKTIVSISLLKILIRLAKDIQALENKKYIQLEQSLQEFGRMLGGWKKSIN